MKVKITHLKAPWPEGASVGDVLDLPEPAPQWAAGKFAEAGEGDAVTVEYRAPTPVVPVDELMPLVAADADLSSRLDSVTAQLEDTQGKLADVTAERDALLEKVTKPVGDSIFVANVPPVNGDDVGEAGAPDTGLPTPDRDALTSEAQELGIKVDKRWSTNRLAEEVAKAK